MRYTMIYKICERFKSNADVVTVQTPLNLPLNLSIYQ